MRLQFLPIAVTKLNADTGILILTVKVAKSVASLILASCRQKNVTLCEIHCCTMQKIHGSSFPPLYDACCFCSRLINLDLCELVIEVAWPGTDLTIEDMESYQKI